MKIECENSCLDAGDSVLLQVKPPVRRAFFVSRQVRLSGPHSRNIRRPIMQLLSILLSCLLSIPVLAGINGPERTTAHRDRTMVRPATFPSEYCRIAASRRLLDDGALLPSRATAPAPELTRAGALMRQSGIRFTENRGQVAGTDGKVRNDIVFTAYAPGANLFFRNDGISYVFTEPNNRVEPAHPDFDAAMPAVSAQPQEVHSHRLDMILVGSNPHVRIRAEGQLPGYSNYYLPHCPNGITGVREYSRVVYENVYDNVDFEFFSSQGRMKYNFVVRPGGRVSDIAMRYDGAMETALTSEGALSVATPLGSVYGIRVEAQSASIC